MASAAKTLRVSFVQCRGTPYEVGRAQADAFALTRKGKAFLRRKVRLPWWFNIRTEEGAFKAYAPALWEEIGGIADGLNIPMEQAVTYFGNDSLRMPTGGCSAVISGSVYGRNYDFRPRGYEARFALVQARGSYASIGGSHQLTGRLDGMNEHGLTIGLHLVRVRPCPLKSSTIDYDKLPPPILDAPHRPLSEKPKAEKSAKKPKTKGKRRPTLELPRASAPCF